MDSGFLIINKPAGITSFGVIAQLRKITGVKKIGHAGTLDPMATGVLICAIGRDATRKIDEFHEFEKVYEAEIEFGKISDTYDAEGTILDIPVKKPLSKKDIKLALESFVGEIEQMPPAFSAKKIKGTPAYKLARQGKAVKLKANVVTIHDIDIKKFQWPKLRCEISCSSGTYIRSIAHDLGQALGVGGILTALKRTRIGPYLLKNAKNLDDLNEENWQNYLIEKD